MNSTSTIAAGGALAGYGLFATGRAVLARRPDLGADLSALFATPAPRSTALQRLPGRLCDVLRASGLTRLLLADDVALADRSDEAHMASRVLHLLGGPPPGWPASPSAIWSPGRRPCCPCCSSSGRRSPPYCSPTGPSAGSPATAAATQPSPSPPTSTWCAFCSSAAFPYPPP
ncbi:hypothetical protein [Frankia sp. R82]|uniref:hypothetical protein n=1 Tax=Frankia sp. R82 TaxID=2950553 RepID=UPI0020444F6B|nr:hypothetical protein [Frankia sp. R82]MCM3883555.1 hypothetical protein [Frankia sp. R82]